MTRFPQTILPIILRHEGGKVDNPRDPGGRTNMGIIQRTYNGYRSSIGKMHQDVFLITKTEVAAIYTRDYWGKIKGAKLPHGIDLATFDSAVNSGPSRGVKWLQGAVGVKRDGKVGPATISAADAARAASVVVAMCSARMGFLRRLRHWGTFKRGWTRRVAEIEAKGVAMAQEAFGLNGDAIRQAAKRAEDKAVRAKQHNQTGAGGTAVGGGGATQIDWGSYGDFAVPLLIAAAAILVFVLIWKSRTHKERALAYRRVAERKGKGK